MARERYPKPPAYEPVNSDFHVPMITGNRTPSELELKSHFALYRGVPMSASDIGLRINCPAENVLCILLELETGTPIRQVNPNGPPTVQTMWVMS